MNLLKFFIIAFCFYVGLYGMCIGEIADGIFIWINGATIIISINSMQTSNAILRNLKKRMEIRNKIQAQIQIGCKSCRDIGMWHCQFPNECGQWDEVIRLENELKKL